MNKDYFCNKAIIQKFTNVIVTGPHGSGTKITSEIIAEDFPHLKFLKGEGCGHSTSLLTKLLEDAMGTRNVIFCPTCSGHLQSVTKLLQNILVVFVYKDCSEIREYKKRNNIVNFINNYEIPVYQNIITKNSLKLDLSLNEDNLEEVTYEVWEKFQKKLIPNWIEINHSSLSPHPRWIDATKRRNFTEWQTKLT